MADECMTAVQRGEEMMHIPISDLPLIAREFAQKLCKEVGMCGEVLLTAWAVYAQCVEGLSCDDDLYRARPQDIEWFKAQQERTLTTSDSMKDEVMEANPEPILDQVIANCTDVNKMRQYALKARKTMRDLEAKYEHLSEQYAKAIKDLNAIIVPARMVIAGLGNEGRQYINVNRLREEIARITAEHKEKE